MPPKSPILPTDATYSSDEEDLSILFSKMKKYVEHSMMVNITAQGLTERERGRTDATEVIGNMVPLMRKAQGVSPLRKSATSNAVAGSTVNHKQPSKKRKAGKGKGTNIPETTPSKRARASMTQLAGPAKRVPVHALRSQTPAVSNADGPMPTSLPTSPMPPPKSPFVPQPSIALAEASPITATKAVVPQPPADAAAKAAVPPSHGASATAAAIQARTSAITTAPPVPCAALPVSSTPLPRAPFLPQSVNPAARSSAMAVLPGPPQTAAVHGDGVLMRILDEVRQTRALVAELVSKQKQ